MAHRGLMSVCLAMLLAWSWPSAANVSRDAVARELGKLSHSKVPLFYAACDFTKDGQTDRLIWIFSTPDGIGWLFIQMEGVDDLMLARDFQLLGNGTVLDGDINFGTSFLDRYGAPYQPGSLLTNFPDLEYRLLLPSPDPMTPILADKTVKACEMPGAK